MKYSIRQYAEALLLALENKNKRERREVTGRFLAVLREKRDWTKLAQIIKTLELLYLKKTGFHKIVLESAAPAGAKINPHTFPLGVGTRDRRPPHLYMGGRNKVLWKGVGIKSEIKKILGEKIVLEEKVNPELMAGIRILVDEELFIDASAKRSLDILLQ